MTIARLLPPRDQPLPTPIPIMPTERAPPRVSSRPSEVHDLSDDSLEVITSAAFNTFTAHRQEPQPSDHHFGHGTVLGQHKKPDPRMSMFNMNKSRPELHQSSVIRYPSNPNNINPMHSQGNAYSIFPPHLQNPDPPYKKPTQASQPMFSSHDLDAQPIGWSQQPSHSFNHDDYPDIFLAPKDAENAIKDLLEGAMDEEEDDNDDDGGSRGGARGSGNSQDKHAEKTAHDANEEAGMGDEQKMREGPNEDGTLEGIKIKLLPHQVDGVKWMKQRETGPVKKGKIPRGGILADDMGLGKTIQSISLMLVNQMPKKGDKTYKKHFENISNATLVVAPLALIKQWEAEIKDKVTYKHGLRVCIHHGPQRPKSFKELAEYDVVVTTYQILVSEHGRSDYRDGGVKAGCFGVHWWRVILDEAHSIKNRNAKSTKACCALRSEYRWCLTGTPLQNNLNELQSLICFLRVSPYDNLHEWRRSIIDVLNSNRGHIAIRRLHAFLRCIMKRRKKEILKEDGALVPGGKAATEIAMSTGKAGENREDASALHKAPMFKTTARNVKPVVVAFTPAERKYYQNLEARADATIERMMKDRLSYANALVLLLRLRQACNHPKLVGDKLDKDKDALGGGDGQAKFSANGEADGLADLMGGLDIGTKQCDICLANLERDEVVKGVEMCKACHDDLVWFNKQDAEQTKKKKGEKRKKRREEREKVKKERERRRKKRRQAKMVLDGSDEDENKELPVEKQNRSHQKKPAAIIDSDDEEGNGSWLVPEDQRDLGLGKAGGTDDENAEGVGDTIVSEDEDGSSKDEDGSRISGFIVDDGDASSGELIVYSDEESDLPSLSVGTTKHGHKSKTQYGRKSVPEPWSDDGQQDSASSEMSSAERGSEDDSDGEITSDSTGISASKSEDGLLEGYEQVDHVLASAKIRELVKILTEECQEHKFIVFSQFTSMLNLVEPFLQKKRFGFVRYDGKMRNDAREESLRSLREDERTRVLLCSLKCGSLGLNLTAATRVVILEPFWNPFIEEQAIDRVHRLTQTVDVTVYKLTVGDTVEERILELQEKKRLLAENTIEGSQSKKFKMGLDIKELMSLFRSTDDGGLDASGRAKYGSATDDIVVQDVGELVHSMRGLTRRRERGERGIGENGVYGRRW